MTQKTNQSDIARLLAAKAHEGQFRRDGVTPYFKHVEAVAKAIQDKGLHDDLVAIGFLHDSIEDTKITAEFLISQGIKDSIIKPVIAITKLKDEPLETYWTRVFNDFDALTVKMINIQNNMSDNPTEKQKQKYSRAIDFFRSLDKDESVGRKLAPLLGI